MAKFFITTTMANNGKTFQFHFETEEVATIAEFCEALDKGQSVFGERFDNRDHDNRALRSEIAVRASIVAMIQYSTPPRAALAA